jgi:hypothetical protein
MPQDGFTQYISWQEARQVRQAVPVALEWERDGLPAPKIDRVEFTRRIIAIIEQESHQRLLTWEARFPSNFYFGSPSFFPVLEQRLGFKVDENAILEAKNLGDLIAILENQYSQLRTLLYARQQSREEIWLALIRIIQDINPHFHTPLTPETKLRDCVPRRSIRAWQRAMNTRLPISSRWINYWVNYTFLGLPWKLAWFLCLALGLIAAILWVQLNHAGSLLLAPFVFCTVAAPLHLFLGRYCWENPQKTLGDIEAELIEAHRKSWQQLQKSEPKQRHFE